MGFTKAEAIAAIRTNTIQTDRGALLTVLEELDETVLGLRIVSLEVDGEHAIVESVRGLKQQGAPSLRSLQIFDEMMTAPPYAGGCML